LGGSSIFLKPFSDASKVEIYFFVLQEKRENNKKAETINLLLPMFLKISHHRICKHLPRTD
jgi:hypothetical protein